MSPLASFILGLGTILELIKLRGKEGMEETCMISTEDSWREKEENLAAQEVHG